MKSQVGEKVVVTVFAMREAVDLTPKSKQNITENKYLRSATVHSHHKLSVKKLLIG